LETLKILEATGKVAGIGGLALGVFLLLFRSVITKNIFPQLTKDHAYKIIRQFLYLTFAIGVLGIAAWVVVALMVGRGSSAPPRVEQGVTKQPQSIPPPAPVTKQSRPLAEESKPKKSAAKTTAKRVTSTTPPAQAPAPAASNSAPNGIANSGTIQQATVNNYGASPSSAPVALSASLVNPSGPAIVVENESDSLADRVLWEFVAFRTTDLAFFSFTTQEFGYLKAHSGRAQSMQLNTLPHAPGVGAIPGGGQINSGDNLIGTLSVDCSTCRGIILIVNFVWGSSGWFYEVPNKSGLLLPKEMTAKAVRDFIETLNNMSRAEDRKVIQ